MTKRDVAAWFCKVIGVVGIGSAVFRLLSSFVTASMFRSWGDFGFSLPSLLIYLFVFWFAQGIGTELAAEGEFGLPIISKADLGLLLWRCAGFALLLAAALSFTFSALQLAYFQFGPSTARFSSTTVLPIFRAQAMFSFVQAAIGFWLAFGPRFRAALTTK